VHVLILRVLERGIRIRCPDPGTYVLMTTAYGSLQGDADTTELDYIVRRGDAPAAFSIERAGREPLVARDEGGLLALFDEDLTIELQKLRPDLYVLHAAVLKSADGVVVLVARSGGGKSTLSWALLHHGFGYSSDELGPVDLETLHVHPYARALILKSDPPPPYRLGPAIVRTSRGFHVTAADMPGGVSKGPAPIAAIFFLHHRPGASAPSVRAVSAAEAATRLYANALNPLAHNGDGLEGAIRIATGRPSFELITADLGATCSLLATTLRRLL
jgi:hypothetical protein